MRILAKWQILNACFCPQKQNRLPVSYLPSSIAEDAFCNSLFRNYQALDFTAGSSLGRAGVEWGVGGEMVSFKQAWLENYLREYQGFRNSFQVGS